MSDRDGRRGPEGDPEPTSDWSNLDPNATELQAREREHEAREMERQGREMERQGREMERQAREAAREGEQERRRTERDAERQSRRAERQQHREEWGMDRPRFRIDIDAANIASRFMRDLVSDAAGDAFGETVNADFVFDRMPRLLVRNISGATVIRTGEPGKITVVAKKHVNASSEDRAKRLLQNLEIRMEKHGEELRLEPHLYEQERGWVDLFRGKRFRVDFEIAVPQECGIEAHTVSGQLGISGVRGPLDVRSVSGEISVVDVQGPLRIKSVSGDVGCRRYVGHVEGNTVSGDVTFDAVRIRSLQLNTVSGDVDIAGVLEPAREHRIRTISGDIDLRLSDPDLTIDFRTASGDLECAAPARVTRQGRREKTVVLGEGRGRTAVKTVSGDLTVEGTVLDVPGEPSTEQPSATRADTEAEAETGTEGAVLNEAETSSAERTEPMDRPPREEIKSVLEKLAKGELGVDEAAAALDAARKPR